MASTNTLSITDALVGYLRETGLEQSVLDVQVEELWPKVMGETVAKLTRSISVKNGLLVVHVNSAALKAQLFENRFELVRKLNEAVGAPAIKDCRILG
jgi:predicted nucleic acid-binding Zn ribbon protein